MAMPRHQTHPDSFNPSKLTAQKPIMVAGQAYATPDEAMQAAQALAQEGTITPQDLAVVVMEVQKAGGGGSNPRDDVNADVKAAIMQLMAQQQGGQPQPQLPGAMPAAA